MTPPFFSALHLLWPGSSVFPTFCRHRKLWSRHWRLWSPFEIVTWTRVLTKFGHKLYSDARFSISLNYLNLQLHCSHHTLHTRERVVFLSQRGHFTYIFPSGKITQSLGNWQKDILSNTICSYHVEYKHAISCATLLSSKNYRTLKLSRLHFSSQSCMYYCFDNLTSIGCHI